MSATELERYTEDWRRFPRYTYSDHFCLWPEDLGTDRQRAGEHGRVCFAPEREVLMGFLPGHTRRRHKDIKGGVRAPDAFDEDTTRCALIGISFHTGVVSCLVGNLSELLSERLLEEIIE